MSKHSSILASAINMRLLYAALLNVAAFGSFMPRDSKADWMANLTLNSTEQVTIGATNNATRVYDENIDVPATNNVFYAEPDSGLESRLSKCFISPTNQNKSFTLWVNYTNVAPTSAVFNVNNLISVSSNNSWSVSQFSPENSNTVRIATDLINQDGQTVNLKTNAAKIILAPAVSVSTNFPLEGDYGAIQQAIDNNPFKLVKVGPGIYNELIRITNSTWIVGTGTNTVIQYNNYTGIVVSISSPTNAQNKARVELANLWVDGKVFAYEAGSYKGINATNLETMVLNNIKINDIRFCMVDIADGTNYINDLLLDDTDHGDLGVRIKSGFTSINRPIHTTGEKDHIIDNYADTRVQGGIFYLTDGSFGDGIRNFRDLVVENCRFSRNPGGAPEGSNFSIAGVTVVGYYSNTHNITIKDCTFENIPRAIYFYGANGSYNTKAEGNEIKNCDKAGVYIEKMNHEQFDAGGGPFGSLGKNTITHTNPPAGYYHIFLTNSSANVYNIGNTLSGTNSEELVFDFLDKSTLGRVISELYTTNGIPYSWGLSNGYSGISMTNELFEAQDDDNDAHNNLEEWISDTIPTNENSVLRINEIYPTNGAMRVKWTGGTNARQLLQYCSNLVDLVSNNWQTLHTNDAPTSPTNYFDDIAANGFLFYRIKAER